MLALINPIKTRLETLPQLAGWHVRTNVEAADRRQLPAVDLRCVGAAASATKSGAVMVSPQWLVTLVIERGDTAAGQLDPAMSAVICALHGWQPGDFGGRGWEAMALVRITEPEFASEGVVGYELTFSTSGLYTGQQ